MYIWAGSRVWDARACFFSPCFPCRGGGGQLHSELFRVLCPLHVSDHHRCPLHVSIEHQRCKCCGHHLGCCGNFFCACRGGQYYCVLDFWCQYYFTLKHLDYLKHLNHPSSNHLKHLNHPSSNHLKHFNHPSSNHLKHFNHPSSINYPVSINYLGSNHPSRNHLNSPCPRHHLNSQCPRHHQGPRRPEAGQGRRPRRLRPVRGLDHHPAACCWGRCLRMGANPSLTAG